MGKFLSSNDNVILTSPLDSRNIITRNLVFTQPCNGIGCTLLFTHETTQAKFHYTVHNNLINCHCFLVECQIKLIVSCNDLQYKRRIVGGHGVVSRHATLPTPSLPGCNRKTITGGTTNIFYILKLRNTNLCFQTEVKTAE